MKIVPLNLYSQPHGSSSCFRWHTSNSLLLVKLAATREVIMKIRAGASNQLPHGNFAVKKKLCHKCHMKEIQRLSDHQPEPHCSEIQGTPRSSEKSTRWVAPRSLPVYKGFVIINHHRHYYYVHGVCVGMCMPQYTCASQRTTSRSQFPPSSFWMDSRDQTRSQDLHGLYC